MLSSGDSYSTTSFYIQGGYPSASDPIGQPALPGSTTSGGLNWVGLVTSQLNTTLVLTYDWAYYGADTSNAIINTGVTTDFIAQVGEFEEYLVPAPSEAPWTADDTTVFVWMGINDVGECFWESSLYPTCPIDEVMETYFGLLGDLYNDGVRNFVLLMVPRRSTVSNSANSQRIYFELCVLIRWHSILQGASICRLHRHRLTKSH